MHLLLVSGGLNYVLNSGRAPNCRSNTGSRGVYRTTLRNLNSSKKFMKHTKIPCHCWNRIQWVRSFEFVRNLSSRYRVKSTMAFVSWVLIFNWIFVKRDSRFYHCMHSRNDDRHFCGVAWWFHSFKNIAKAIIFFDERKKPTSDSFEHSCQKLLSLSWQRHILFHM